MTKPQNNYAFIDSQNLYLGIKDLGWRLDYKKFRIYLADKYAVKKAYMFIGYWAVNQDLYSFLQEAGFVLMLRPILEIDDKPVKGNCDVDLAVRAMIDYLNYDKAVIITGDGDFYSLVHYLYKNNKLAKVLAPSRKNCSSILRRAAKKKISLISDLKNKLEYKNTH